MKTGTCRRVALVAPLALLGLAFFLSSVYGQRFPGQPGGRPGFNPNPNPGMPGFNPNPNPGMPGFNPNPNPGMPGFNPNPGMPGVNPNPGMPKFPNTNPGLQPQMPNMMETVWTCSRCGQELSRNTAAPPSRCPHCGAKIMNGVDSGPSTPSPVSSLFGSDSGGSSSTPSKSKFNGKVIALVVGIVVLGIFALLGGTFLMIYTMKSGSEAPARRKRRPRRDDEYDD
jgi:DNA-directed RNA polymerase subunit RPC12/RpoP